MSNIIKQLEQEQLKQNLGVKMEINQLTYKTYLASVQVIL